MNFANSNLNDRITRAEKVETRHEIRLNHLRQDVDNLDKNAAENLDRIFALEYVIGKIKRDGIRPSEDILIDDDDVIQYCVQRLKLPCRFNAKILKRMTVKSSLTQTLNAQELVERVLESDTLMRKK